AVSGAHEQVQVAVAVEVDHGRHRAVGNGGHVDFFAPGETVVSQIAIQHDPSVGGAADDVNPAVAGPIRPAGEHSNLLVTYFHREGETRRIPRTGVAVVADLAVGVADHQVE